VLLLGRCNNKLRCGSAQEGGLIAEGFNGRGKWNRTGCVALMFALRFAQDGGELELGRVSYPALIIHSLHAPSIVHHSRGR
jgi:hypothetical protein